MDNQQHRAPPPRHIYAQGQRENAIRLLNLGLAYRQVGRIRMIRPRNLELAAGADEARRRAVQRRRMAILRRLPRGGIAQLLHRAIQRRRINQLRRRRL